MIKRNMLRYAFFVLPVVWLSSCTQEANPGEGEYGPGIFVVNEGNFGSNNASVSFIDRADGQSYNDIYSQANNGVLLGDVAQSILIHDGKAYIVVNNSSKIEVVDGITFKHSATISGLTLPRFMTVQGNKAYLTQWVSLSGNGKVSVIDLATNTIGTEIPVGVLPERMLLQDNHLYVTNSNDTVVHIINTTTDAVETTVTVGDWPSYIVSDANGLLWVLCSGVPAWAGTPTAGSLVAIDPQTHAVVHDFTFPGNTANPAHLCIDPSGNRLFYFYNGGVYAMGITDGNLPSTPLFPAPLGIYGMGIDPASGMLYVADAGSFTASGWVRWHSVSTGAAIDSASVGLAPNSFFFLQ